MAIRPLSVIGNHRRRVRHTGTYVTRLPGVIGGRYGAGAGGNNLQHFAGYSALRLEAWTGEVCWSWGERTARSEVCLLIAIDGLAVSMGTRRSRPSYSHRYRTASSAVQEPPPAQGCRSGMAPEALVSVIAPVVGSIHDTFTSTTRPPSTTPTDAMIRLPSGVQVASPGRREVVV